MPQFLGSPGAYARLLGREIAAFYVGPLLVVMPNGFGSTTVVARSTPRSESFEAYESAVGLQSS